MSFQKLNDTAAWKMLKQHADIMKRPEKHLKHLIKEESRLEKYSIKDTGMFFDFSRQRVDEKTMDLLFEFSETRGLRQQFSSMINGEKVNITEDRAALHTASRNFSKDTVFVDEKDIMPEIRRVRDKIRDFVSKVHKGEITGSTGKPFKHLVVIGIGGSYLGTEFVSKALQAYATHRIEIEYLSNVDVHNFGRIASCI